MPPHAMRTNRVFWAFACVVLGSLAHATNLETLLQDQWTATSLFSHSAWHSCVSMLGGKIVPAKDVLRAEIDFAKLLLWDLSFCGVCWICGAGWIARRSGRGWHRSLFDWGVYGWLWWLLPGVWELLHILQGILSAENLKGFLFATPQVWQSLMLAGWAATLLALSRRRHESDPKVSATGKSRSIPVAVWIALAVYVGVFTAMNWQLYRGLLIPHGDSAMYEEHLWNMWNGKGFRSYLDQGLFLGEHIQVVHLLLTPFHFCWSSHLLLEVCESLALASGAIPVYWIARRHSRSCTSACLLAIAYLLYTPLQFLDIAIDLKTFRPISFGVPLFLFALDQLERRRYRSMTILLLLVLSAKEDYGIMIAGLGVWIAFCMRPPSAGSARNGDDVCRWYRRKEFWLGITMSLMAAAYVVVVVLVVLPYFRGGSDPHYTRYFGELGNTPGDIARTALESPLLVLGKLFSVRSTVYALALLMPLGFLPLLSPTRLAVALPLFSVLCLMELSGEPLVPFHHFHAPLVPIILWAAAAGLGNVDALARPRGKSTETTSSGRTVYGAFAAHFAWTSSLAIGFFFSLSPLGLRFWDAGSSFYHKKLYVAGKRAELFERVFARIPITARVASTDHVHTRFTHHQRSYDYSPQRRKVSDYADKVPDDTEYIVIDTQHPYSEIKRPEQLRELRREPDRWQVLPDDTEGYFIVLKRK